MAPTKFRVNLPFSSEEEGKNRFSRLPPSWNSDRNDFSYFYIYKSSRSFLLIFKSTGPLVQESKQKKKEFQDGRHDGPLGFPIQTILAILDLQVTRMLPTTFGVNGLSVQEKRKIDFQNGCYGGRLISGDFSYF